jgi:hypothetical protein
MRPRRWVLCYFSGRLDMPFGRAHFFLGRHSPDTWLAPEEICVMRQFASLLRSGPSRIARRLAHIVAIAAASLPAAGA